MKCAGGARLQCNLKFMHVDKESASNRFALYYNAPHDAETCRLGFEYKGEDGTSHDLFVGNDRPSFERNVWAHVAI